MSDEPDRESVRQRYRTFSRYEAQGVSPLYEAFSEAVASDDSAIDFLLALPREKQQPNLLLAACRWVCGVADSRERFLGNLQENAGAIRHVMLTRATQTNEPARCATLLPVLAQLPQPLALIEVGVSAGLCLYPDRYRYRYRYGDYSIGSSDPPAPEFHCLPNDGTPLPDRPPQVAFRAGIDLNPLDVRNRGEMDWLETLVWPEQTERLNNLRRAIALAGQDPPNLTSGDLLAALPAVAGNVPRDAHLVIFHSAVLAYVPESDRRRFVSLVGDLDATWISNEHPAVLPEIAASLQERPPLDRFLLAVNGTPVASTGPHGQSINWLVRE